MKSNKYFSLRRFYLLLSNDIQINYKNYLLTALGALLTGVVILYLLMPHNNLEHDFRYDEYTKFFVWFLLCLGVFVGMAFPELDNKTKISNYLLLPSSVFEKFLEQFFIRILVGSVVFCAIFWLDTHIARHFALSFYKGHPDIHTIDNFHFPMLFQRPEDLPAFTIPARLVFILGIFSTGTYLFSVRIFFRRFALMKTVISLAALFYIILSSEVLLSHVFFPETVGFKINLYTYFIAPLLSNHFIWISSLYYLSWLFLLFLGYFKLKEKQL